MAIAFVAAADGGNNGGTTNSHSFNYTCGSGSNRALFIALVGDIAISGVDDITGVTYNSVSCTLLQKAVNTGQNRFHYIYYLLNPASGSNSVAITCTNNHYLLAGAADYTGIAQSGQPDNNTTNLVSGSSATTSLVTVADNCWTFLMEQCFSANNPPAAGTGSTLRVTDAVFGTWGWFDSNAPITPAGSYSMTTTRTAPSYPISHIMASLSPAGAAAAPFLLVRG